MRTASLLLICWAASPLVADDWVTAPSFYTHDGATGLRTHQYTAAPTAIVPQNPSYRSSGYRHYRSSLQYGQSADNYHRVEQWGPPVQPYGEWRFPYRPYSVPYDQWGAPLAGLNIGGTGYRAPWGHGGGYGGGAPGQGYPPGQGYQPTQPSTPYPSGLGTPYPAPPYADGYYPDYPVRPRPSDEEFFNKPSQ